MEEGKHPLVSVPGVAVEEQYGAWMQVKTPSRQRQHKSEQQKTHQNRGAGNMKEATKEHGSSTGSRFDILQNQESGPFLREIGKSQRNREAVPQWRKKEGNNASQKKEGDKMEKMDEDKSTRLKEGKQRIDQEEGQERVKCKAPEQVPNAKRGADVGSSLSKGKGKMREENNNEGFEFGCNGPSQENEKSSHSKRVTSKKRASTTRPKIVSPLMKRKQQGRAHNIVFGSLVKHGPLNLEATKPNIEKATDLDKEKNGPGGESSRDIPKHDSKYDVAMEGGDDCNFPPPSDAEKLASKDSNVLPRINATGGDLMEQHDLWFETQDEVGEEAHNAVEALELSDLGQ